MYMHTQRGLPKNLGGHDETGSGRVDLHIAGDQPHITECCLEVTELLIGQRFDRGCVHGSEKKHTMVQISRSCPDYILQWSRVS